MDQKQKCCEVNNGPKTKMMWSEITLTSENFSF